MKSTQIVTVAFIFFSTTSFAQQTAEPAFKKGSKSIGISAGFGRSYSYYGDYHNLPAVAITYDQGFFENAGPGNIGIGGILAVKTANYKYSSGDKAHWNNYVIGIRGTYHLTLLTDKNNKFDPYAGVMLGLRIYDYKDSYYSSLNPYSYGNAYVVTGVFVGAKYNFARTLGAFAELGYDISFVRAGLCLNF